MANFITKIFGSRNQRLLRDYSRIVPRINALEEGYKALSDDELESRTRARLVTLGVETVGPLLLTKPGTMPAPTPSAGVPLE